jgi:RHS repeat-associated protein
MRVVASHGRPSRVEVANTTNDLQYLNRYDTYYLQYNWHGDAATPIDLNGGNAGGWSAYDPWGNPVTGCNCPGDGRVAGYYNWNGGFGYQYFSALGMYYVHGRWYSADIGRFISPDAKGESIV